MRIGPIVRLIVAALLLSTMALVTPAYGHGRLPTGRYECYYGADYQYKWITIRSRDRYRFSFGGGGKYRHRTGSARVVFRSGPLDDPAFRAKHVTDGGYPSILLITETRNGPLEELCTRY